MTPPDLRGYGPTAGDAGALADEYFAYRQSVDLHRLLSQGSVEHLAGWEDVRPDALAARRATLVRFAHRAGDLAAAASLGSGERALVETMIATARSSADQLEWAADQTMVNPAMGLHATIANFIGRFSLVTAVHGGAYLDKLARLPALLTQLGETLAAAAAGGRIALTRHLLTTAEAVERLVAGAGAPGDPLCAQPPPAELTAVAATRWRERRDVLVVGEVRPALVAYAGLLRRLAPAGRGDDRAGLVHLPDGAAGYGRLVGAHTTTALTPGRVHQIGLERVHLLEEEYRRVAGPLLGTTDVGRIYARLRDDPALQHRDGAGIVRDATEALDRASAVATRWFRRLPSSPCLVEETDTGALAFYSIPDPATDRPGRCFFHTADPSAWGTHQVEAVTFHETIPGHHLQLGLHAESGDLHPVHRFLPITAYLEGWGLYAERLADEMGCYRDDLSRVGMLAADSLRACRLVVDTGLHALGWSRAEAIAYMTDHAPLGPVQVADEVDRYIGAPGQALSYMIGRLELDRVRREAERRADFDIRDFHDRVLGHGMVPLGTVERLVLDPGHPEGELR